MRTVCLSWSSRWFVVRPLGGMDIRDALPSVFRLKAVLQTTTPHRQFIAGVEAVRTYRGQSTRRGTPMQLLLADPRWGRQAKRLRTEEANAVATAPRGSAVLAKLSDIGQDGVVATLDWNHSAGGIASSRQPTTVLNLECPRPSLVWRHPHASNAPSHRHGCPFATSFALGALASPRLLCSDCGPGCVSGRIGVGRP